MMKHDESRKFPSYMDVWEGTGWDVVKETKIKIMRSRTLTLPRLAVDDNTGSRK